MAIHCSAQSSVEQRSTSVTKCKSHYHQQHNRSENRDMHEAKPFIQLLKSLLTPREYTKLLSTASKIVPTFVNTTSTTENDDDTQSSPPSCGPHSVAKISSVILHGNQDHTVGYSSPLHTDLNDCTHNEAQSLASGKSTFTNDDGKEKRPILTGQGHHDECPPCLVDTLQCCLSNCIDRISVELARIRADPLAANRSYYCHDHRSSSKLETSVTLASSTTDSWFGSLLEAPISSGFLPSFPAVKTHASHSPIPYYASSYHNQNSFSHPTISIERTHDWNGLLPQSSPVIQSRPHDASVVEAGVNRGQNNDNGDQAQSYHSNTSESIITLAAVLMNHGTMIDPPLWSLSPVEISINHTARNNVVGGPEVPAYELSQDDPISVKLFHNDLSDLSKVDPTTSASFWKSMTTATYPYAQYPLPTGAPFHPSNAMVGGTTLMGWDEVLMAITNTRRYDAPFIRNSSAITHPNPSPTSSSLVDYDKCLPQSQSQQQSTLKSTLNPAAQPHIPAWSRGYNTPGLENYVAPSIMRPEIDLALKAPMGLGCSNPDEDTLRIWRHLLQDYEKQIGARKIDLEKALSNECFQPFSDILLDVFTKIPLRHASREGPGGSRTSRFTVGSRNRRPVPSMNGNGSSNDAEVHLNRSKDRSSPPHTNRQGSYSSSNRQEKSQSSSNPQPPSSSVSSANADRLSCNSPYLSSESSHKTGDNPHPHKLGEEDTATSLDSQTTVHAVPAQAAPLEQRTATEICTFPQMDSKTCSDVDTIAIMADDPDSIPMMHQTVDADHWEAPYHQYVPGPISGYIPAVSPFMGVSNTTFDPQTFPGHHRGPTMNEIMEKIQYPYNANNMNVHGQPNQPEVQTQLQPQVLLQSPPGLNTPSMNPISPMLNSMFWSQTSPGFPVGGSPGTPTMLNGGHSSIRLHPGHHSPNDYLMPNGMPQMAPRDLSKLFYSPPDMPMNPATNATQRSPGSSSTVPPILMPSPGREHLQANNHFATFPPGLSPIGHMPALMPHVGALSIDALPPPPLSQLFLQTPHRPTGEPSDHSFVPISTSGNPGDDFTNNILTVNHNITNESFSNQLVGVQATTATNVQNNDRPSDDGRRMHHLSWYLQGPPDHSFKPSFTTELDAKDSNLGGMWNNALPDARSTLNTHLPPKPSLRPYGQTAASDCNQDQNNLWVPQHATTNHHQPATTHDGQTNQQAHTWARGVALTGIHATTGVAKTSQLEGPTRNLHALPVTGTDPGSPPAPRIVDFATEQGKSSPSQLPQIDTTDMLEILRQYRTGVLSRLECKVKLHDVGSCKPCAFFHFPKKLCNSIKTCHFCHHEEHRRYSMKCWKRRRQRITKDITSDDLELVNSLTNDVALVAVETDDFYRVADFIMASRSLRLSIEGRFPVSIVPLHQYYLRQDIIEMVEQGRTSIDSVTIKHMLPSEATERLLKLRNGTDE